MNIRIGSFRINLNISQIIALTFLGIILLGAILLSLPIASANNQSCGFLTALFTSTSSVCVTGLSVVDVWSSFSFFGQVVMLLLIEAGGLGFMSIISLMLIIVNRQSDIQSLSIIAGSLGTDGIKNIVRIQKRLIYGSLIFEAIGAIILFFNMLPQCDIGTALWLGIFHSVSSFCNAGFDLMGLSGAGNSMATLQNNPVALITLALLVVIGGIGFIVWDDIVSSRSPRRWSVNTRLVLSITGILLLVGTILYMLLEYNNPETLGGMNFFDKLVNSFFQSVTPRTAGFGVLDQSSLTGSSNALTMLLMLIGGSAASTAGGIKTVTFAIVIVTIISNARGKRNVVLRRRTITSEQVAHAFTITGAYAILSLLGGFIIALTSNVSFRNALYESVSALATVGLSLGLTPSLTVASKLLLIAFMYIGRVGLLTITLGFFKRRGNPAIKYPSVNVMIG